MYTGIKETKICILMIRDAIFNSTQHTEVTSKRSFLAWVSLFVYPFKQKLKWINSENTEKYNYKNKVIHNHTAQTTNFDILSNSLLKLLVQIFYSVTQKKEFYRNNNPLSHYLSWRILKEDQFKLQYGHSNH